MTKEEEKELKEWLKAMNMEEVINLIVCGDNHYNRQLFNFFISFSKWAPIAIMLMHMYGMWDFSQHPREMLIPIPENQPCYVFIYIMVYIVPLVIMAASRFYVLCWVYRIPFFYFFGVNAIHIVHWSIFTTNSMVMSHFALMVMIGMFYLYFFSGKFFNSKIGRRLFNGQHHK